MSTHSAASRPPDYQRVGVIDSHTEGEPTRVVISGGPDLGTGSVADMARVFRSQFDWFRSTVVNEPRGNDAVVGALIVPAQNPRSVCGVIFFNNVGLLNACGHGTIGLAATLKHMGRIGPGSHIIETPVGEVTIHLSNVGTIRIDNVPSFRKASGIEVPFTFEGAARTARGDVAWGGNWFFLTDSGGIELSGGNLERLTAYSWAIRQGIVAAGITGADGAEIDHIELFGPPSRSDCDSKNFVLCPGKAYDRSPCGTGTSAKLACLYADGKLAPGQEWGQESIIGSKFTGSIRLAGKDIIPSIAGAAYICAEATLLVDRNDPFAHGIRL